MKKSLLYLILILSMTVHAQSPWVRPAEGFYGQFSVSIIPEYDQLYLNNEGPLKLGRKITDITLQGWFEYGVSENSTIQVVLPVKLLKSGAELSVSDIPPATASGHMHGLGNIQLAWRQKLYEQSMIISGQLGVDLPASSYQAETGLRPGYDAFSVRPSLSIGRGYGSAYLFGNLGIAWRSNGYSDLINIGLEGGYKVSRMIWISGVVDILQSLSNGSRVDPDNNYRTGLYLNDQEYFAWGIKAFADEVVSRIGFSAALFGAFAGNFVARAPALNFGINYKL